MATVFIREWRYLEGERREEIVAERRRYEERVRALFREGRERGELRTDLDDGAAALLVLSAANWAYTWLSPGATRTLSRTRSPRSSSTGSAATRRHADPVRTTLIVNPYASKVTPALAEQVAQALGAAETVFTERAGHATELAREADAEAVVVFSGDGGFNEALNGARPETVLGFVPGGGTSVLPRALGLPRDPVAAAGRLAVGRTRRIGLGRANGRRFSFAAGVGLDAELIRRMDARGRRADGKRPGDAVFAWTAVKTLAETRVRFDPALEVEGHGRAAFALVANADPYTYLGRLPLRLPRGARLEGGLDLLAPRSLRVRSLPGAVRYIATGRTRLPLVELHDADRISIRCDGPMPLQLDGEDLGDVTEVVFEAERDAISVLV